VSLLAFLLLLSHLFSQLLHCLLLPRVFPFQLSLLPISLSKLFLQHGSRRESRFLHAFRVLRRRSARRHHLLRVRQIRFVFRTGAGSEYYKRLRPRVRQLRNSVLNDLQEDWGEMVVEFSNKIVSRSFVLTIICAKVETVMGDRYSR